MPPSNSIADPAGLLLMACCSRSASELLSWQVTLIVAVTGTAVAAVEECPVAAAVRAGREYQPAPKPTQMATMTAATAIGSQRRRPRFWGRLSVVWSPMRVRYNPLKMWIRTVTKRRPGTRGPAIILGPRTG